MKFHSDIRRSLGSQPILEKKGVKFIMKRKLMSIAALLTAGMLVLTACGGGSNSGGGESGGGGEGAAKTELIVAQGADAKSLDPHGTNDQPSSRVMRQIYETLVDQNEKMELLPGLAESWEQVDDSTYQFNLKKGVKFHNGEEFKASDVKFTMERALESANVGHIVEAIDKAKIEVVDDYTIKIGTKEPFAPLLAHLAHTGASILNEKAVTEAGEDYGQNPVGTGPFKFESWATGDSIVLVRNDEYHRDPAKLTKVTFRAIPEDTNRTIELETGGVDIVYDISPNDIEKVESNEKLTLVRDASLSTGYIGFNCAKAPFDNVKVRQAINTALDTESIINTVYKGVGSPAKGPLTPQVWASNQNLEPYGFDVEKAKALMAEAGYADGFKTTIWTNENPQRMAVAEVVQNQLKAIGIETEVKVMEWGAYLDGTAKGEHDMFILGWVTVTGDPDYGLFPLFHSSTFGDAGNRTFYSTPKVDELLEKGRFSVDPAEREAAYMEVQQIVRDDAPWVFMNYGENISGTASNVKGFMQHPAGHYRLYPVYFE